MFILFWLCTNETKLAAIALNSIYAHNGSIGHGRVWSQVELKLKGFLLIVYIGLGCPMYTGATVKADV